MQEKEFRAYDKKLKKWLFNYETLGGFSLFGEVMVLGEWASVLDEYIFNRNGHCFEDLVVMQYTGLTDKNGKKIYEGDIVKDHGVLEDGEGVTFVKFMNGKFVFDNPMYEENEGDDLVDWCHQCEVIGNIYENPELLNK
jgi:uncharacterized phage protein (TIGR01671 family)